MSASYRSIYFNGVQGTSSRHMDYQCFIPVRKGLDVELSVVNSLPQKIYSYYADGTFIGVIEQHVPPKVKGSLSYSFPSSRVLEITSQTTNITGMGKKEDFCRSITGVIRLTERDLMGSPVHLPELGIILATDYTKELVRNVADTLREIFHSPISYMANDLETQRTQSYRAYGNVSVTAFPKIFAYFNGQYLAFPVIQRPELPEGVMYIVLEKVVDTEGDIPLISQFTVTLDLDTLRKDPDGVVKLGETNYILSHNYSLVKNYVEKRQREAVESLAFTRDTLPKDLSRDEAVAFADAQCELEQRARERAEAERDALRKEADHLRKQNAELNKEKKRLYEAIDEAVAPETVEDNIRRKKEDAKHERTRKRFDVIKTALGIAASVVALVTALKEPIKAGCKWLASAAAIGAKTAAA